MQKTYFTTLINQLEVDLNCVAFNLTFARDAPDIRRLILCKVTCLGSMSCKIAAILFLNAVQRRDRMSMLLAECKSESTPSLFKTFSLKGSMLLFSHPIQGLHTID